jgi:hypothetical protein
MGFYIRKAFRVGPLRLNLSRSGIGLSAGVRGARVGVGPRGSYLHAGREGLYYRKTLGRPRSRYRARSGEEAAPGSTPATVAVTPRLSAFLHSIRRARALRRLTGATFTIGAFAAFLHAGFLLLAAVGLGFAVGARSLRQVAIRAVQDVSIPPPPVLGFLALTEDRDMDLVSLDVRPVRVDGELVVFDGGFLRFLPEEVWFAADGRFGAVRPTPGRPTRLLLAEPLPGLEVTGERYRHERLDGGPDRRYSENVKLVEATGVVTRLTEEYAFVVATL